MSHLEVSNENGIATLTMNRPEARNALSMEMRKELIDVLHDVERDNSVRCVLLKGAGDHFKAWVIQSRNHQKKLKKNSC